MTYESFRQEFNEFRTRIEQEALREKQANLVWINLAKLWSRFDADERSMAVRVLGEWLQSEDSGARSDAEFLIREFNLVGWQDDLRQLAARLAPEVALSAPIGWELKKIEGILAKLMA
jgi:hypothetical protein